MFEDQPDRCPICMGNTSVIKTYELIYEKGDNIPDEVSKNKTKLFVLLDNIRSGLNVGSIFRTADAFGFSHIYICGITPTPDNPSVAKTSLGAEDSVNWSYHKDAFELINGITGSGLNIVALEETVKSLAIPNKKVTKDTLLILGNEKTGVDPDLLRLSHNIYHLPMRGKKKSLNVATAFSAAAYVLTRQ